MERINKLLENNPQNNPYTSMRDMELALVSTYDKIRTIIPESALLVTGSASFYHHYHKYTGEVVINDLDLILIHNGDTTKSLFDAAIKSGQAKMLRDDCLILQMGNIDLHIDLDYKTRLQHFRSGVSSPHRLVRYMNKTNIDNFYRKMGRPKDQAKLLMISLYSPHARNH